MKTLEIGNPEIPIEYNSNSMAYVMPVAIGLCLLAVVIGAILREEKRKETLKS